MSTLRKTVPSSARAATAVLLGVAAAGTLAHASFTVFGLGKPGLNRLFNEWVYDGVLAAAATACLLRGILVRRERAAWLMIAAGVWSWTVGDLYWNVELAYLDDVPYPSVADFFYIAGYPALYVGIVMLARARLDRFETSLWLDGLIGALAVAAVGAAFLYPVLQSSTEGDVATVAVNLAYPLGDLLLLAFVVAAVALTGWRPDRDWGLLGVGLAVTGIADGIYLQQEATVGYTPGWWPDTLWLAGTVAIAAAAWTMRSSPRWASAAARRTLVLPGLFALVAVTIVMYDHFERVSTLAIWLVGATLVAVIVRMTFAFEENVVLLRKSQREALTDPLTGLGNRRRLLRDLARATEEHERPRRQLVAIFDLDGFKAYNDSFGHPAGDALLAGLGHKLAAAVELHGRAYRLGGDEFCVLATLDRASPESILEAASAALCEEGEAFVVRSSRGGVLIPDETNVAAEALRLADHRMYAQKGTRPGSAERQTSNVLVRSLHEREPHFGTHLAGVARLAVALGRAVHLDAEELDVVTRGARLHDVGKMAVPDEILRKPAPLDEREWEVMRSHTLTGERILASAPALVPVAKLVRSTHERWDGNGYPDGLAREQIPLGARIIFVCDAYEAMIEERPYRTSKSPQGALAELRRCAGTQFDPRLVELFSSHVFPALAEDGLPAGAPLAVD
jgi:two-component system cell cycle response regulator